MDGTASTTGGGRNNGVKPRPTYVLTLDLRWGKHKIVRVGIIAATGFPQARLIAKCKEWESMARR